MSTSGATRGRGGSALGAHLDDAKRLNEITMLGDSRGLVSQNCRSQIKELTDIAAHARSKVPLYHLHVDPAQPWTPHQWDRHMERFETEFGLEKQPFLESIHIKHAREHRHRVYSLVKDNGSCIRMDNDFARREKLGRVAEIEFGEALTPGRHNRAAIAALRNEGRDDIAQAMEDAGLHTMERSQAKLSPRERDQMDRTGVNPAEVGAKALASWKSSDDGRSFRQALQDKGLRLAMGDKVAVLVDEAGGTHPLAKMLGKVSKAAGDDRIDAAGVTARIADIQLDPLPEGGRGRRREYEPLVATPGADPARAAATTPTVAAPAAVVSTQEAPAQAVIEAPADTVPAPQSAGQAEPSPAVSSKLADKIDAAKSPGGAPDVKDNGHAVAPVDFSKPGDVDRFMRGVAAAEDARAKREINAGKMSEGSTAEETARLILAIRGVLQRSADADCRSVTYAAARTEAVAEITRQERHDVRLNNRPPSPLDVGRWESFGGRAYTAASERIALGDGSKRTRPGDVRGVEGRREYGQIAAAVELARATAKAGADTARPDHSAVGSGSSKPDQDRGIAGADRENDPADRLRARRQAQGLAAAAGNRSGSIEALTARLTETPDRLTRPRRLAAIDAGIAASEQRIATVMQTAPYPDPATRDAREVIHELRERLVARLESETATAVQAGQAAASAKTHMGILGRLGLPTVDRRAFMRLAEAADAAQRGADLSRDSFGQDARESDERAPGVARSRQSQQNEWECKPEVRLAVEEKVGNDLVKRAIADGNTEMEKLAAKDLAKAREEMLRRQAKIDRLEREQALQQQRQREAPGHQNGARPPAPSGPRR